MASHCRALEGIGLGLVDEEGGCLPKPLSLSPSTTTTARIASRRIPPFSSQQLTSSMSVLICASTILDLFIAPFDEVS